MSLGSFEETANHSYDENDSTLELAEGRQPSSPNPASSHSNGVSYPSTHQPSSKTDRYKSLGKKNTMSYLTTSQQASSSYATPESSTSQLRLVSTPSPMTTQTSRPPDPSGSGQPPAQSGSATSRWIRRVASAPNTKLFSAALSFKNAPSLPKSGPFPSSNGDAPPSPHTGTIPVNDNVVTLSSDTESSTRSTSGGKKRSGGQKTLGVLGGHGLGKTSSQSTNSSLGNGTTPGKAQFRRTYSSNSIKLREVRPFALCSSFTFRPNPETLPFPRVTG